MDSVSAVCCTGVTVATGTISSGSHAASSHFPPAPCLLFFCADSHSLSLSLFPFPRQQVTPEFVYLSFCVYSEVYVDSSSCVGGRGGGSLHPSGEAADPAALQACGESRQERFPVPQEALPQRNPVSTTHSAELLLLSLMVFLILISRL